ncbi:MAG: AI-2E family transporter [Acutalibacteraceae bacterium]|nr:AI-2E family transporter [Acutalibacteraceae bacterium]
MDKKLKHNFLLVAFGVALYAILMNIGAVYNLLGNILKLSLPVVIGFVLAFILNVPMKGFEKLFFKLSEKLKKEPKKKLISIISLCLTLICVIFVIAIIATMLIPELVSSIESLYKLIVKKTPEWIAMLKSYDIDTTKISEWLSSFNFETLIGKITNSAGTIITSVVGFASSAVSGVSQFLISIIIAIYILLSKDKLSSQIKILMDAHLKKKTADKIYHICRLINDTYSKFLSGQCIEACILGVLIFISFSIFRMPYASLIGVLTAVCAFVPYIGAFASCFVGAFLILLVNPSQVVICVIVYLVVQFIENQFIYPNVVGTSVGLSPLWTLIAVLIGGSLMGLFGMIFFIPLCAVLLTLLKEHTNRVIEKKKTLSQE